MLHYMLCLLSLTRKLVLKRVYLLFHTLFSFPNLRTDSEACICGRVPEGLAANELKKRERKFYYLSLRIEEILHILYSSP